MTGLYPAGNELDVQCQYCDTLNDIGATKCSVCDADIINDVGRLSVHNSDVQGSQTLTITDEMRVDVRGGTVNECVQTDYVDRGQKEKCVNVSMDCGNESNFEVNKNDVKEREEKSVENAEVRILESSSSRDKYVCADQTGSRTVVTKRGLTIWTRSFYGWACSKCTFLNDVNKGECEVCGVNREEKEKVLYEDDRPDDQNVIQSGQGGDRVLSSGIWECPSCTFNNKLDSQRCDVCYTIRETEVPRKNADSERVVDLVEDVESKDAMHVIEDVTNTWKCRHCQSDNLLDKYVCAKCHKFAPFLHKWPCEKCSFFNTELSPLCAVCDHKNAHLRKCDKCGINVVYVDNGGTCGQCCVTIGDRGSKCQRGDGSSGVTDGIRDTCKDVDNEITVIGRWLCPMCGKNIVNNEEDICGACADSKWYCNNLWCCTINNIMRGYCRKCGLKKESNVTQYNEVEVYEGEGNGYKNRWQCTYCGLFNGASKCTECKNMRHLPTNKKCVCNWVHKSRTKKCDKCIKIQK